MGEIKYRATDEMKDSGVEWIGMIPRDWRLSPLNTVFIENKRKNKRGLEKNVLSLSYGNIIQRDVENNFGLLPASFNTYQIIDNKNLIFRLTDLQNDKKSLRVGLVKERGIITSAYLGLINKINGSSEYFYFLFHTYDLMKVYYNMGGGLRQTMTFEDMKKLPTLIPTKNEQIKISNFLDIKTTQFNSIISKKEKLIQKLEEAKKSLISEVITGKVKIVDGKMVKRQLDEMKDSGVEWLGMIPNDWGVKRLSKAEILTIDGDRGTNYPSKDDFMDDGHCLFLNTSNIKNNSLYLDDVMFISEAKDKGMGNGKIKVNDIIITTRGTVGSSVYFKGILPHDHVRINSGMLILRNVKKYLINDYFFHILKSNIASSQYKYYISGSVLSQLPVKILKSIQLPVPGYKEQECIYRFLDLKTEELDFLINKSILQIQKLKQAKQSLISEAVTGKIDLRDWEIIEEGE